MARVRDRIDIELRQIRDKLSKEAVKASREGRFLEYLRREFEEALREFPMLKVHRSRPRKLKDAGSSRDLASARAPRRKPASSKGRRRR